MKPDLKFVGSGSVYLLKANTPTGADWIAEHIDPNAMTFGGGVVVEWRYVDDIANGAMNDGLTVGKGKIHD